MTADFLAGGGEMGTLMRALNARQVADAARAAVGNGLLDAGMEVISKPFAMAAMAVKVCEMIER